MSEYHVVEHATHSPTSCFFCMNYVGPFIDTNVENPAVGYIYICQSCITQMGRLMGMELILEMESRNTELSQRVAELESGRTVTMTYDDLMKAIQKPRRTKRTLETTQE